LVVKATDSDGKDYSITMDQTNLVWQAPVIDQDDVYEKG
tara:strand:+ start:434 stop:550 length:117 start_codon:yes stop_codon:yes gene_type:complete